MKITTKIGDDGKSSLFTGKRLRKSDNLFSLLGDIDELTSFLGWTKAELLAEFKKEEAISSIKDDILKIQDDLYKIMSYVGFEFKYPEKILPINDGDINFLEEKIEFFKNKIPKINEFLRPGEGRLSSMFHVSRSVCRRAERSFVGAFKDLKIGPEQIYLNRLSDFLFVLAVYFEKR